MALPKVYTVKEVSEILSLGRTTTYAIIRRGILSSVKVGTHIRVTEDAIRTFLEQGNVNRTEN